MFRLNRNKILPLFLASGVTIAEFSRRADVHFKSVQRALNGARVSGVIIGKMLKAFGIDLADASNFIEKEAYK